MSNFEFFVIAYLGVSPLIFYWAHLRAERNERLKWLSTVDSMSTNAHESDHRLRDVLGDLVEFVTGSRP